MASTEQDIKSLELPTDLANGGGPKTPLPSNIQSAYVTSFREARESLVEATAGVTSYRLASDSGASAGSTIDWSRELANSLAAAAAPLPWVLSERPLATRMQVTQRWDGVVTHVGDDWFMGRIHDPSRSDAEDLVGEFAVEDISEDDAQLLAEGAWFYVTVAMKVFPDGRRSTESSVRFRRLPRWRSDEIAVAEERAKKLGELLDLDSAE